MKDLITGGGCANNPRSRVDALFFDSHGCSGELTEKFIDLTTKSYPPAFTMIHGISSLSPLYHICNLDFCFVFFHRFRHRGTTYHCHKQQQRIFNIEIKMHKRTAITDIAIEPAATFDEYWVVDDVLKDLLERVSVITLAICRFVCRRFRQMAPLPLIGLGIELGHSGDLVNPSLATDELYLIPWLCKHVSRVAHSLQNGTNRPEILAQLPRSFPAAKLPGSVKAITFVVDRALIYRDIRYTYQLFSTYRINICYVWFSDASDGKRGHSAPVIKYLVEAIYSTILYCDTVTDLIAVKPALHALFETMGPDLGDLFIRTYQLALLDTCYVHSSTWSASDRKAVVDDTDHDAAKRIVDEMKIKSDDPISFTCVGNFLNGIMRSMTKLGIHDAPSCRSVALRLLEQPLHPETTSTAKIETITTILMLASDYGHFEFIKWFADITDLNFTERAHNIEALQSIKQGHLEMFRFFTEFNPTASDSIRRNYIESALRYGRIDILRTLILPDRHAHLFSTCFDVCNDIFTESEIGPEPLSNDTLDFIVDILREPTGRWIEATEKMKGRWTGNLSSYGYRLGNSEPCAMHFFYAQADIRMVTSAFCIMAGRIDLLTILRDHVVYDFAPYTRSFYTFLAALALRANSVIGLEWCYQQTRDCIIHIAFRDIQIAILYNACDAMRWLVRHTNHFRTLVTLELRVYRNPTIVEFLRKLAKKGQLRMLQLIQTSFQASSIWNRTGDVVTMTFAPGDALPKERVPDYWIQYAQEIMMAAWVGTGGKQTVAWLSANLAWFFPSDMESLIHRQIIALMPEDIAKFYLRA